MVNMPVNDTISAVNEALVRTLIAEQFPQWAYLPVRELCEPGGTIKPSMWVHTWSYACRVLNRTQNKS